MMQGQNIVMEELAKNTQARRWCFTWNNYPNNWKQYMGCHDIFKYMIVGYEVAPTTGTPHLQGYCELSVAKRMSELKKIHGSISWRACKGNQQQNITYCSKGGIFEEFGEKAKQGQRNDLNDIRDHLRNGGSMVEVAENHFGSFVRYNRGFREYQYLILQQRLTTQQREVFVEYIFGPSGTGKTKYVWDKETSGLYAVADSNTGFWWTGYQQNEAVLFDDFRGTVPLHTLLKWLDRYPCQVPIHGGMTWLGALRIYITSNVPLEGLYKNCDQASRDALRRRIHKITQMGEFVTKVGGNTIPPLFEDFAKGDRLP